MRTIYLYPDMPSELYNYVGTTGVYMIGTITPEQRPQLGDDDPTDVIKAIQNAGPN